MLAFIKYLCLELKSADLGGGGGLGACHHSPPLTLCHNESCEVGVQLILLVDTPLLNAIPALLLGDAQSAGDVVPKVEPLLLSQIVG